MLIYMCGQHYPKDRSICVDNFAEMTCLELLIEVSFSLKKEYKVGCIFNSESHVAPTIFYLHVTAISLTICSFLLSWFSENYSSIIIIHLEVIDGKPATMVVESFVVDVPDGILRMKHATLLRLSSGVTSNH